VGGDRGRPERFVADDARWGRIEQVRPPLPAWAPLAAWLAIAFVLSLVVIVLVGEPGPLDDPQQGDQRAGLLIDPEEARNVRELGLPGRPVGRRPVFLAFARRPPSPASLRSALDDLPTAFATFLVLPDTGAAPGPVPAVGDPDRRIAQAVGMAEPKDGGTPIGYAVVDDGGLVRYATIDPRWPDHGDEIGLIAEAVR
jgi:hypothetical protein